MATHTAGNWAIGHAGFDRKPVVVAKRAGRPVTVSVLDSGKAEEDEANAKLIAAAPDLLRALRGLVDIIEFHMTAYERKPFGPMLAISRAALDKAGG